MHREQYADFGPGLACPIIGVREMTDHYDVVQIGYGPVGQTFAALLGKHGYKIGVFERELERYPFARAGHVDDEIMRIFQGIGAADEIEARAIPIPSYEFMNASGERLLHIDWSEASPSGWKSHYLFYQPYLEDALIRSGEKSGTVTVHRGWEAVELVQHADHVQITLAEGRKRDGKWVAGGRTRTVTASYVIGADGANSFVRQACELNRDDLGFSAEWLVVDLRPHQPDADIGLPDAAQICNPMRPASLFRWGGREHSRGEFMLLPGETAEQMQDPATVWKLFAPYGVGPDNVDIVRRAVYRFRGLLTESFRNNRVLLMGDSAHLMPPFLGQGACAGIRDAQNLAWKLDLVLRGLASSELLDTYTPERKPHVEAIIRNSIALGQIVCVSDPEIAAKRDQAFLSGMVPPPPPFPGLTNGILHRSPSGKVEDPVGQLAVQGRVRHRGVARRFDDVFGPGWMLLSRKANPLRSLSDDQRAYLDALGVRAVYVTRGALPEADDIAMDYDLTYTKWFSELGVEAVLVRPDFYIYGTASTLADLSDLVDGLARQVPLRVPAIAA